MGLLPKSIISTYLCFFPVTIGMVKGLTSPDHMLIDLMRTYNASTAQVLWKLRWPASLPFLFASLKVAVAIALVGAIVGELPTGAQAGIGARLLTGSYYGQTIQIWAALFAAAIMAAALVCGRGCGRTPRRPPHGRRALTRVLRRVPPLATWSPASRLLGIAAWLTVRATALGPHCPALLGSASGRRSSSCGLSPGRSTARCARLPPRRRSCGHLRDLAVPAVFGATLLFLWEAHRQGVRRPARSVAGALRHLGQARDVGTDPLGRFRADFLPRGDPRLDLWARFSGFLVAILCDRIPFLKRGLLPLGSLVAALPIVGIAPIMVMWFGFDWHSKAAVVVIMTFFPMLVNALSGLEAAGHLERDLMRSYGASHAETLLKLRLPAAMPFIFNALKINSTLALIGAIVAEFFGTPIVGMGFQDLDRGRPPGPRHGLGGDRGGGAGGIGFLRCARADRAHCHVLASVVPDDGRPDGNNRKEKRQ